MRRIARIFSTETAAMVGSMAKVMFSNIF
jgi:hypothetical protein